MIWFWFSFALGLLPILLAACSYVVSSPHSHPIRQGDAYLLAATLCFIGVGEMFRAERKEGSRVSFLNVGGGTAFMGLVNAFLFAIVSANVHPHSVLVDVTSGILYPLSAFLSLLCVVRARK
ncbi:MAG TPA: hypothetical protein VME70_09035 [Mycobacteriales bacterium]|nr:hypothetical protein [Mycobacteriales bacterium]